MIFGTAGISTAPYTSRTVMAISPIIQPIASSDHQMAVKTDGTVWAWGWNASGQVGDGTTTPTPTPRQVPGLANIVGVAAGSRFSLAMESSGQVWAWGYNLDGELGIGSNSPYVVSPSAIQGLPPVTRISAGYTHAIALDNTGQVWIWGAPSARAPSEPPDPNEHRSPFHVAGLDNVQQVSAGSGFFVILKTDGTLWAWGDNSRGQIGPNGGPWSQVPVQVTGIPVPIRSLASANDEFSLAVGVDDSLWGWGGNTWGALNTGQTEDNQAMPVQIRMPDAVMTASNGGSARTIAVSRTGAVWGVGVNLEGQLGTGVTEPYPTYNPVYYPPARARIHDVVAAASGEATLFLVAGGDLYAAGDNTHGDVGDGSGVNQNSPVPVMSGVAGPPPVPNAVSATGRTVVFVHDFAASYFDYLPLGRFAAGLTDPLRKSGYSVAVFQEFQDTGFATADGKCDGTLHPPGPELSFQALIPVDPSNSRIYDSRCDSQGDLGLNASKLETDLLTMQAPVTVVGYSMGGAIVRGWMSLAQRASSDGTVIPRGGSTSRIVDSIGFVQGAQQGSWMANLGRTFARDGGGPIGAVNRRLADAGKQWVRDNYGVDVHYDRPALAGLVPQSPWYTGPSSIAGNNVSGVNDGAAPPTNVTYFNFYTNYTIQQKAAIPLYGDINGPSFDFGDGLLRPGEDAPNASPGAGGARFLPSVAAGNAASQFSYHKTLALYANDWPLENGTFAIAVDTLQHDPGAHLEFETHMADERIRLPDCRNQIPVTPLRQVVAILQGLDYGTGACPGGSSEYSGS